MTQFEWQIGPLDVRLSEDGLSKVITAVHWRIVATRGDLQESAYGTVGLAAPDADDFTPFEQLEKSSVISWVIDALGEDHVASMKESLESQLDRRLNPVEISMTPPWSE